jgi:hypothetical protein
MSLIVKKQPNAKELLDKLVPYQGWIGLVVCVWGVWTLIRVLMNISPLLHYPIWLATFIATGVLEAALGFVLGYALISKYALSSSPEAAVKGEQVRQKLVGIQIPLGLAGAALGVWCLLESFVHL